MTEKHTVLALLAKLKEKKKAEGFLLITGKRK